MINEKFKKILAVFVLACTFLFSAYTFPSEKSCYYITCDSSLGNAQTIYIPFNQNYRFSVSGNQVINVSSSSITGYTDNNQTVSFPVYDSPYIRTGTTTTTLLNISNITAYNLPLVNSPDTHIGITVCIVGLLIFALLVFKR